MNKEQILQLLLISKESANIFQPTVTEAELSLLADEIIKVYNENQPPTPSTKHLKAGFLI